MRHVCCFCQESKHRQCINTITAEFKSAWTCVCSKCYPDPLLDEETAAANKEDGMRRASVKTPYWYRQALWDALVVVLCGTEVVSADLVWEHLGEYFPRQLPAAPRAAAVLGPIMASAAKAGLCFKTGAVTTTTLVTRHGDIHMVYESKICGHDPGGHPYPVKQ